MVAYSLRSRATLRTSITINRLGRVLRSLFFDDLLLIRHRQLQIADALLVGEVDLAQRLEGGDQASVLGHYGSPHNVNRLPVTKLPEVGITSNRVIAVAVVRHLGVMMPANPVPLPLALHCP